MKLPVIKHLLSFVEENDVDYLEETIEIDGVYRNTAHRCQR